MILHGITDGKEVVASMSHYDCRSANGLMMDGGQRHTLEYAGYNRWAGGKIIWFEVPQNFAELYSDYNFNKGERKYGHWQLESVKVLPNEFLVNIQEEQIKNAIWGTRGKNGLDKLKYVHLIDCESEHLENILESQRISDERRDIIQTILRRRNNDLKYEQIHSKSSI